MKCIKCQREMTEALPLCCGSYVSGGECVACCPSLGGVRWRNTNPAYMAGWDEGFKSATKEAMAQLAPILESLEGVNR